jgi:hypothetical protein
MTTASTEGDATHVPVVTVDAKGRVTSLTAVAIAAGGVSIGDSIGGGTATELLFVDGSGDLGQDSRMTFSIANGLTLSTCRLSVLLGFSTFPAIHATEVFGSSVTFCQLGNAAVFSDGTHTVSVCDGTNNVSYTPGTSTDWLSTPPSDVWLALDRLAAWLRANFPALPKP